MTNGEQLLYSPKVSSKIQEKNCPCAFCLIVADKTECGKTRGNDNNTGKNKEGEVLQFRNKLVKSLVLPKKKKRIENLGLKKKSELA